MSCLVKSANSFVSFLFQTEQLVFLWVLFIFIVVGNGSVLAAISLSETGKRTRMNYFIMHLAIADLSAGLVNVLTDIVWKTTVEWYAGNIICKIVRYCQAVVTFASTYVLVSLSVDRFDAVAWPMNFSNSASRARMLIGMAWTMSLVFSAPALYINNEELTNGKVQCWISFPQPIHWKVYFTLLTVVLFILPALVITMCYTVIVHVIWSKGRVASGPKREYIPVQQDKLSTRARSMSKSSSSRGVIPQAKIRTIKMTLIIVIVFILCWSPYFIFNLVDIYGHVPEGIEKYAISTFIQSLAPLNSAANPIIYGIFSTRVCRNLRRIRFVSSLSKYVYCQCQRRRRGRGARRLSGFTASWSDQTHITDSKRNGSVPSSQRRTSALPLTQRHLSERDSAILKKNLVIRFNKGGDSGIEVDTDAVTEV
ncbi:cardioacceleratory peptide receptor-like [Liolophura sinensis]|uniref:cardioacceleratory peptide receptor-like n=1 Tax=Liolophura sinensis TaxID=3198878 RepID=UPI003158E11E